MAARDPLLLDKHHLAGLDVVVEPLLGLRRRGHDEADEGAAEICRADQRQRIGLGGKRDRPFLPVAQPLDDDARQRLDPLEPDQMPLENIEGLDGAPRVVGHDIGPVRRFGRGLRGCHDAELLGIEIGADEESLAIMIERAQAPGAAGDDPPRLVHRLEIDDRDFRIIGARCRNDGVLLRRRRPQRQRVARIALMHELAILRLRRAQPMRGHGQDPVVVVERLIEQGAAILRPHDAGAGLFDDIGKIAPACHIADADGEALRTGAIGAPGDQPVIGGRLIAAGIEKALVLGNDIEIEHHLLTPCRDFPAEHPVMLGTRHIGRGIFEAPAFHERRGIVLLHPPLDLALEPGHQRPKRREIGVRISILRLDMAAYGRRQLLRLLQHLAPIVGFQPAIGVDQGNVMHRSDAGLDRRHRRFGGGPDAARERWREKRAEPACCRRGEELSSRHHPGRTRRAHRISSSSNRTAASASPPIWPICANIVAGSFTRATWNRASPRLTTGRLV